jgi:preprotein translocase subunit SecF
MIPFLKFTKLYFLISIIVIGIGVYALVTQGLKLSIDFTGGSVIEYNTSKSIDKKVTRKELAAMKVKLIHLSSSRNKLVMRTSPIDEKQEAALRAALESKTGSEITINRFETVGPSLGGETMKKTAIASLVAILGILIYISYTFKKIGYGLAAISAMLHDFLVLIGMYAVLGYFGAEIDALFITALLTTMAFSVHDTIVVFDKIREFRRTSGLPIGVLANKALTETMVRSLNNSLTIILMLVPLTFIGGESIRFFGAALLIGTITGTYSSPFIATPLLVLLEKKR